MQDLLREQAACAERMLAISQEISSRLGEHAAPAVATTPTLEPQAEGAHGGHLHRRPPRAPLAGADQQLTGGGLAGLAEPLLSVAAEAEPGVRFRVCSRENSGGGESNPGCGGGRFARQVSKNSYQRNTVFPDPEAVKEHVRRAMTCAAYDVEDLYHPTGFAQSLARSNTTKNVTFLVIALNSVWIAVDTDFNKADDILQAAWEFQLAENLFCCYFTFELATRYLAFRHKRDAFRDGWFVFDSILVVLMVFSTWLMPFLEIALGGQVGTSAVLQNAMIFRVLRLFRLARVGRLVRLLRDLPELMVLAKGMVFAIRAVFSTLFLLVMIIYVFAIIFTQTLSGSEVADGCFDSVPQSMHCLLVNGVFADQSSIIGQLLDAHWSYYVILLLYLVFVTLVLLNMLIGVMCEVVEMVSNAEKDEVMTQTLKDKIGMVLKDVDTDGDHVISPEELKVMIHNKEAMQALSLAKIDVVRLVDFADCIFQEKEALDIGEFVETVLQFRSDNTATVKDLIDSRRTLMAQLSQALGQEN